jgi:hypothetical protein
MAGFDLTEEQKAQSILERNKAIARTHIPYSPFIKLTDSQKYFRYGQDEMSSSSSSRSSSSVSSSSSSKSSSSLSSSSSSRSSSSSSA